jgi:cytochrome c-type biogenesis protein CcmH
VAAYAQLLGFGAAAAALTGVALAFLVWAPARRAARRTRRTWRASNIEVQRARLCEIDASRAAGELSSAAHRQCTEEIWHEVLDEVAGAPSAPATAGRSPALFLALTLPLLAVSLYWACGNPGALAGRAESDLRMLAEDFGRVDVPNMIERLEAHVERTPRDGRAWVVLARLHMETDRFFEAAQAYERALGAAPAIGRDPQIWCEWADALGMTQGGVLAGRPLELIGRALALDPHHPRALEMAGSAAYDAGQYAIALSYWEQLYDRLAADGEARTELGSAIERTRARIAAAQ